jgi:hypothetical protein
MGVKASPIAIANPIAESADRLSNQQKCDRPTDKEQLQI